ncbi:MAG: molybdate ABC transporter permease subunit, partial [Betaproteobacteria bacterium]
MTLGFSDEELQAILLTLKVATFATLGALPIGIAWGWLLARKRFPGRA